jgi:hypothetical protein
VEEGEGNNPMQRRPGGSRKGNGHYEEGKGEEEPGRKPERDGRYRHMRINARDRSPLNC